VLLVAGGDDDAELEGGAVGLGAGGKHRRRVVIDRETEYRTQFGRRVGGRGHSFVL
jgi:hypothetical protein